MSNIREKLLSESKGRGVKRVVTDWSDEELFVRLISGKVRDEIERFCALQTKKDKDAKEAGEDRLTMAPILSFFVFKLLCDSNGDMVFENWDDDESAIMSLQYGLILDIVGTGCAANRLPDVVSALESPEDDEEVEGGTEKN